MLRVLTLALGLAWMLSPPAFAVGQDKRKEADPEKRDNEALLKKEIELLQKEVDLLKRENEVLKKENAALKKGDGGAKEVDEAKDSVTRALVDNVEYEYAGATHNGNTLTITVLATSKENAATGLTGPMTLIDDQGEKYVGRQVSTSGGTRKLVEGVPVKLQWQFGGSSVAPGGFGGFNQKPPPAPSAKIKRFAAVIIEDAFGGGNSVEFRNVPVGPVKKPK